MTKAKAKEYWFARRFPIGNPRGGIAPVHWKGWACALIFCGVMLVGAGSFAYFALMRDEFPHGAAIFAVLAIVGGGWFILVSQANADRVRTVEDYKREKTRV